MVCVVKSLLCVSPTNTAQDYLFLLLQTAQFSDVLLLPIQKWFVALERESLIKLKQICTSVLRSTLSNFSGFCGMRDLCGSNTWQMHMREGPHHHTIFMVKASFFGPSGAQCVFCGIQKSEYFHLTCLQLQIKGQAYIYAHRNVLSLELTINSTFDWICLTILIATLSLTLLETSLSLWHNLDVHRNKNKVLFSSQKSVNGMGGQTRGILAESQHIQHKLSMDSPATSAWSSSSRFRTQRRKQLVPCRWTECQLSPTYFL